MERINSHQAVWHEFVNVLRILNIEVHKEFADHLMGLLKHPDRYFVWDLLQLYENSRVLANILNDLSHPPAQPLEPYSILYISSPGSYEREAMKHSNRTRQTIKKPVDST